ncbi:hypothetical protein HGH92_31640 [Chitinophaga varians]|uniref:Methylamine utilisation protein MauE domain-containing protein n=1 Tax=Chitinophaga varians TaxID=2202339 RepID=A0A847S810_9BACT|nr:MauE/DoxX family redox-associated membrane protein [Chitinophaga varians]NLR68897.1 hypothetical protein [Chitinophaga varians]
MKRQSLLEVAALAYILMFSYAAASKLFDVKLFTRQLRLQPFNLSWVPFMVWAIPTVELLVVLLLILPKYRLKGLYAAIGLMIVFTAYILVAKSGVFKYIPCSCGGVISKLTWTQHLWFNLIFLIIGLLPFIIPASRRWFKLS